MSRYLYRGVCEEKYIEDGKSLKPYQIGSSESEIMLDDGHYLDEGFVLGASDTNSVIKHQKDSKRYHTPYISTTPFFDRAKYYALEGAKNKGYVFKINRELLKEYGVQEKIVRELAIKPKCPEDDEVELYTKNGGELPKELIVEIIEVFH